MAELDLSFLFENPEMDTSAVLIIEPLAPLSIVSTLPGSYYKSQDAPTKYNLCGMFENVLGWHLGIKERKAIQSKMKKDYKKKYSILKYNKDVSAVGYLALIGHLFEIKFPVKPAITTRYDDLWTQQMKDKDKRHMDGTANLSWQVIKEKNTLYESTQTLKNDASIDKKEKTKKIDNLKNEFVKNNLSRLPMYYTKPTIREFIVPESAYMYKLSINSFLLSALEDAIRENNIAYLGTSEGWVNLSIKEL